MRKLIILGLSTALLAGGMSSCSSSESVVSNGFLQKRKYNKGFHKSIRKNIKSNSITEDELVIKNKTITPSIESKNNEVSIPKLENSTTEVNLSLETNLVVENTNNTVSQKQEIKANEIITDEAKPANSLKNNTKKLVSSLNKNSNTATVSETQDVNVLLLYILCFFIPFLAVGIVTDWNIGTVILNLLLCLLFFIPGLIHALIVVSKNT